MSLREDHAALVERLKQATWLNQVTATNRFWNAHIEYATDQDAWGQQEFWPSLADVLSRYGDDEHARGACATYALAKCGTLGQVRDPRTLGYAEVVAEPGGFGHMVALSGVGVLSSPVVLDMLPAWKDRPVPLDMRTDLVLVRVFRFDTNEAIEASEVGR